MSIQPSSFLFHRDESTGVATIVLNRPERLNALTFEVYRELRDTFDALDDERDVRAVVITGQGKAFCSGGDVRDIIGPLLERDFEGLHEFTTMTCDLIRAIRGCPRPVIAAINGTVAGAGAVIAAASDLRIAAESARIAFLFTRVGLSGADMGISWLLPRLVGHGKATELLVTGDFIDAREALRIGLYNRVVHDDRVLEVALDLAEKIARGPAFGLRITREALESEWDMTLEQALEQEAHLQAVCMMREDFREAYRAFVEKRQPVFNQEKEPEEPDEPEETPANPSSARTGFDEDDEDEDEDDRGGGGETLH